jgi:glucose-6-phosphate 1-dehydrogenase
MMGDATLFERSDMVEAAWKVVAPIQNVWGALEPREFPNYPAGTWGPGAAADLLTRDGRHWYVLEPRARVEATVAEEPPGV